MITDRADLREIVEAPAFQRALRRHPKDRTPGRQLWSLYHLATGTAGKEVKRARRALKQQTASGLTPLRQSQKETDDGVAERISV